MRDLWVAMNNGAVSVALGKKLLRFNGNIFANPEILPLDKTRIGILLEAKGESPNLAEPNPDFVSSLERYTYLQKKCLLFSV